MANRVEGDPWQNLANAIVKQAADDYRSDLKKIPKLKEKQKKAEQEAKAAEKEFKAADRKFMKWKKEQEKLKREREKAAEAGPETGISEPETAGQESIPEKEPEKDPVEIEWENAKERSETAEKKRIRAEDNLRKTVDDALSIERFCHSGWYGVLTSVDGDYLINRLREEVLQK